MMDLTQGTLLYNRYRIERKLGQGGMGSVFLAYDTSLETWVAVKSNQNQFGDSPNQFLREAHLLASLRNPNLPRVIDYFLLDQSQYLVMDYIPGEDLEEILKKNGAQPIEKVMLWARQLGDALSYLHSQNPPIIHRDIKPANLKLNPGGQVALVDFGLAKASDQNQATATGASGYTPGFAPPEQVGGTRTGPYSDQYSFAATLYALLTGNPPEDGIQRLLGKADLTPLNQLNPQVPPYVANALARALSVRPDDRFASVAELVQALTQPNDEATLVRPKVTQLPEPPSSAQTVSTPAASGAVPADGGFPPSPHLAQKKQHSFPLGWIAAGILIVCLVAGVVGTLILRGLSIHTALQTLPISTATPLAFATEPQPTQTPTLTPTTQPLTATPLPAQSSIPQEATASPVTVIPPAASAPLGNGGVIAFSSNRADGNTYQLWTMRVSIDSGGQVSAADYVQISNGDGDKTQPAWSPDGKYLLYVAPGGKINGKDMGLDVWSCAADGSNPVDLTQRPGDDTQPAWSPDGRMIAFSNNGREDRVNQIYFMTPQGGSQTRISLDLNESAPVWSPDMKWLLYVISSNDYPFLYMRSSNQNYSTPEPYDRNKVTGRLGQVSEPAWSPDGQQVAFIRLDGGHKQLWSVIYATHGGSISRLTEDNDAEGPAWSPDSKWIVFSSVRDGKRDIYLMTVAGTLQTNLTNDDAVDLHPVWQPQPAVQN